MIKIQEISPPNKVSGLSSVIVSFDYNPIIVDAIKTVSNYEYDKKTHLWEIPMNCLAQLLDALSLVDNIQLSLLEYEEPNEIEAISESEISQLKWEPFKHQVEAINFGLNKRCWLLLDSMGTGKTNTLMWLAETLKTRGIIDHCLVICGINTLKQNWKKAILKFGNETVRVLGERKTRTGRIYYASVAERAQELMEPIEEFFVVTNIETLRDPKIMEAFKKTKNNFGMIALDEAHKVNRGSTQGDNFLKLNADYKVAATGTLITNSPLSCYTPLKWIGKEHANVGTFKSQYCEFGGFHDSQVIGYKNLTLLKDVIDSCSLRRTLDDVKSDMPPKTVNIEVIELEEEHKRFYDAIREGVKEEADLINLKSANLLALTTRLRQATACPSVLTSQDIPSSKVLRCKELVDELVSQGEKVVILSVFKETVSKLKEALAEYNPSINTGDIPDDVVSRNIDDFQTNPNSLVFIGTWDKVSTGITLNAAAYMICIDTPYTYAMFSQGTDRIWRVDNTRPAFITVLVGADTIDERVMEIIETKKDLSDFLVDGVDNAIAQNSLNSELYSILRELF
ncbi:MAG: DEAD/DEAH box helicase [Lachnospiraceae bacterium]|nr:DEAD/DEAH box helicase [Lachnospiraceae bacterium]MBO5425411.1 DEAD/DEAH box helicase [Lachnospiraceae bacterium]